MTDIPALLSERAKTHGDFRIVAQFAQFYREWVRTWPNYHLLTDAQKEVLDMDATKQARIACGDPRHRDHWIDRVGYNQLGAEDCDR